MTMFFDAYAALRKLKIGPVAAATSATTATQHAGLQPWVADVAASELQKKKSSIPVGVADVAIVAAPQRQIPEPLSGASVGDASGPYGKSIGENPRTWTGKVVCLEEWRQISEWERHGSAGKMWNGLTQKWEPAE